MRLSGEHKLVLKLRRKHYRFTVYEIPFWVVQIDPPRTAHRVMARAALLTDPVEQVKVYPADNLAVFIPHVDFAHFRMPHLSTADVGRFKVHAVHVLEEAREGGDSKPDGEVVHLDDRRGSLAGEVGIAVPELQHGQVAELLRVGHFAPLLFNCYVLDGLQSLRFGYSKQRVKECADIFYGTRLVFSYQRLCCASVESSPGDLAILCFSNICA